MGYKIRVQSVAELAPSFGRLNKVYPEVQKKSRSYIVSISDISDQLAETLETEMRQIGGTASVLPCSPERKCIILSGVLQQFGVLSDRVSSLSPSIHDLSRLLMKRLENRIQYPQSIEIKGHRFAWGQRTYMMGIMNITPDSFSGDGLAKSIDMNDRIRSSINQAEKFLNDGADILDVGGESTRPGGESVETAEEIQRVVPIIRALSQNSPLPLSVDTQKAKVAEAAMKAGASIINDIWGLQGDPDMARVAADYGAVVVVMHNKDAPLYQDLISETLCFLEDSLERAERFGIHPNRIWVDPGIGFGKTREHNLEILERLDEFRVLGQPILLGTSRKSVIGLTLNLPVEERLEGTAATVALGVAKGADIMRVHDVLAMTRAARMSDAIMRRA